MEKDNASNLTPVPVERVRELILLNADGKKVKSLLETGFEKSHKLDFQSDIVKDDLTRFDKKQSKGRRKKKKKKRKPDRS